MVPVARKGDLFVSPILEDIFTTTWRNRLMGSTIHLQSKQQKYFICPLHLAFESA